MQLVFNANHFLGNSRPPYLIVSVLPFLLLTRSTVQKHRGDSCVFLPVHFFSCGVCWKQLTVSPIIKQEGSWVVQEICATCSIRRIGILEEASEVLPPDSRILDVEVYYRRSTSSLTKLSSYILLYSVTL